MNVLFAAWLIAAVLQWLPSGITPVSGIYPGSDSGSCCWMERSAVFRVQQPANTDTMAIDFYAPDYALEGAEASVTASIQGEPPLTRCCVRTGLAELAFPLERTHVARTLTVRLHVSHTFVPANARHNGDTRALSLLLRGAAFEDSLTGTSYGDEIPSTPPLVPRGVDLLVILAGAVLAFAAALRRPALGVAALIIADPFSFSVAVGSTTLTLPKAVLIAVAAAIVIRLRRIEPPGNAFWLLLAAQGAMLVSMLVSSAHAPSAHAAMRETLKTIEFLSAFVVAYLAYRLEPDRTLLLRSLAAIALAVTLLAFAQAATGIPAPSTLTWHGHVFPRLAGALEGPNQLAAFLGILLPVLWTLSGAGLEGRIARSIAMLAAVAAFLTFSRGGIVALASAAAVVFVARNRPAILRPTLVLLGCVVIAGVAITLAAAAGALPMTERVFGAANDTQQGLGTRTLLWHTAYQLWRSHPLFGVGPGNFELLALRAAGVRTHANSVYVNTLAEQGLFGMITLAGVISAGVLPFVRRAATPLAVGALAASCALAVHQIVDTVWIYPKVGEMWWIVLALAAASVDQRNVVDFARDVTEADPHVAAGASEHAVLYRTRSGRFSRIERVQHDAG